MKKAKVVLILSLLLLAVVGGIAFSYFSNRVLFSEGTSLGNLPGNIYNGGYFCQQGSTIYFSNFNDDGVLYSMNQSLSQMKRISGDKVSYLNADQNYLYYCRVNNLKNMPSDFVFQVFTNGVVRSSFDGKKQALLYEKPSGMMQVYKNYIYYQHYTKESGVTLHQVKIDGSEDSLLSSLLIPPASIYQDRLYYTGLQNDRSIHAINLKNASSSLIWEGQTYLPISTKTGLYYIATLEDYSICKVTYDGRESTTLVTERCSTYNITEDERYLYYQVDGGDQNRICVMDLQSGETQTLLEGNFKEIHLTANYVFFRSFDELSMYSCPIGMGETPTTFNPIREES